MFSPLAISNPDMLRGDRLDWWLMWFPLVGWLIGAQRQVNRTNRAKAEVRKLLEKRSIFPSDAWRDAGFDPARAEAIAKALPTRLSYLPNHYFLPNDPILLVTLDWEGIGILEAGFAVYQCLGMRKMDPKLVIQMRTFADFVAGFDGQTAAG
jgi:hypothetical protein